MNVRRHWLSDAIIAGFVAIGTATAALMVAYVAANGAADANGDIIRRWLWQLTHNEVVSFSRGTPAVAIILHIVLGLVWAIVYARFIEPRRGLRWWIGGGPGWSRGMRFSLLPWLVSLFALLPLAAVNMLDFAFSAGPLPPIGNLLLHLIYGFTLGQLYDASADEPALAQDLVYDEPLERPAIAHSEDFGAAGIVVGAIVGAAVGIGMAVVLPPTLPNIDSQGWSVALAVGGILAGGAVGGIVGSFAGLPNGESDPAEIAEGEDPFDHTVLPFLLPPVVVLVIAAIIVSFGTGLLRLGKDHLEIGPIVIAQAVIAALIGIVVIGVAAVWLASRPDADQSRPSSRETVSHTDH
jgi:uncharacterized membrane protein YagU involved in acid resistance